MIPVLGVQHKSGSEHGLPRRRSLAALLSVAECDNFVRQRNVPSHADKVCCPTGL